MPRKRIYIFGGAALLVLLAAGYLFWSLQPVEIRGRVALRTWDGSVAVPDAAQALVFAGSPAKEMAREQLRMWPEARAKCEARCNEARAVWEDKVAQRDEARRILRVAEQANAADLAACRDRYDGAKDAAQHSYAALEECMSELEQLSDPAALLAQWQGAEASADVSAEGSFVLRSRVGRRPVLVVLVPPGPGRPGQVWLERVSTGGAAEFELSNTNLLTLDGLREFAGLSDLPGVGGEGSKQGSR